MKDKPMKPAISIDDYFLRIGFNKSRPATFETLDEIQFHHTMSIPFENFNPFLGLPVRLDMQSLMKKLVYDKRGGYCFEHNLLLKNVLGELGFKVTGLAASVRWNVPQDVITARGHMLLLVGVENERYIVDVGFGVLTPTAPLRLVTGILQETPHERFRLLEDKNDFILQVNLRNEWKSLYRFDLQEQFLPDYEVTNWYLSNNPESHFVTGLIVDQPAQDRRYALHNNILSVRHLNGTSEKIVLDSVEEIRDVLTNVFSLRPPDTPELDTALERIIAEQVEEEPT